MTILITGSCGLIGSESVLHFSQAGCDVVGIDNNLRREFFGLDGDTSWNLRRLQSQAPRYRHCSIDIRDRNALGTLFQDCPFEAVIHTAAQPSHDLAASRPLP
jgi:CDP-paratose 2-epimerase